MDSLRREAVELCLEARGILVLSKGGLRLDRALQSGSLAGRTDRGVAEDRFQAPHEQRLRSARISFSKDGPAQVLLGPVLALAIGEEIIFRHELG